MNYGEKIRQAREVRGLTQQELADKIKKSKAIIAQVEGGFKLASDDLLASIADATEFPISFFSEPIHAEFPIPDLFFRSRSSIKRREVVDAVRWAEHVFHLGCFLASKVRRIPVQIPSGAHDPHSAARSTRRAMQMSSNEPIPHLVRSLERAGLWFIAIPPAKAHDAFCVWMNVGDLEVPIIAATVDAAPDRFRLSVAHELGHLVMHKNLLRKSQKEVEGEAFQFGAEFMMPESAMRKELIAPITLTNIARLKPRWGVSIQALIRRANDLNIITTRQYHYLFHQLSALGWKTEEPASLQVPIEKPRLLRKMAEIVYGSPINYRKFSSDVHLSEQELRSIMSEYADERDVNPTQGPQVSPKVVRFPRGARVVSS